MPRISVIIPAHNAAALLAETLDSVIAQTYVDWEAIVADDASTDGTYALARKYHPSVRCVRTGRNLGIGGARNLALEKAAGELIALLDADDLWLPEYLERQIARYDAAVELGEDVGIVCCDAFELGPQGYRTSTYSARSGWVEEVTLTTLLRNNTIFVSAIAPRAIIQELGGFSTDCLGTEDYDLWLRITEMGRTVVAAREPLVIYRVSDSSVSTNVIGMSRATQATLRNALARGRLNTRQRVIARRELRLQRFVELWEDAARRRRDMARVPWRFVARAAPLGVRVALERPGSWLHWIRIAVSILRGAPAAGVDRSRIA